jgi:hypothetical protein
LESFADAGTVVDLVFAVAVDLEWLSEVSRYTVRERLTWTVGPLPPWYPGLAATKVAKAALRVARRAAMAFTSYSRGKRLVEASLHRKLWSARSCIFVATAPSQHPALQQGNPSQGSINGEGSGAYIMVIITQIGRA